MREGTALIFTVNIKFAVIAIVSMLSLGGTGVIIWQSIHRASNLTDNQVVSMSSQENIKKSIIHKEDVYTGDLTPVQKKELQEKIQINKALAWLNSQKSDEQSQYEIQSILEQPDISIREIKALTPEIQKKAMLYAKLASILPEYIHLESLMINIWSGKTKEDSSLEERYDDLNTELINTFGKILRPPAVITDEEGNEYVISSTTMFKQIAEYLGKELPIDGNPDYFSARDYQSEKSYNNSDRPY